MFVKMPEGSAQCSVAVASNPESYLCSGCDHKACLICILMMSESLGHCDAGFLH